MLLRKALISAAVFVLAPGAAHAENIHLNPNNAVI